MESSLVENIIKAAFRYDRRLIQGQEQRHILTSDEFELIDDCMLDFILDYLGVPKENSDGVDVEGPLYFCRDWWTDLWLFDAKDADDFITQTRQSLLKVVT